MNPLQRALIEKAGHEHGFEYVLPSEEHVVCLGSARHRAQVTITPQPGEFCLSVSSVVAGQLPVELARSFPAVKCAGDDFVISGIDELATLLRRAAVLAQALPNQAAVDYETKVKDELAQFPTDSTKGTEVERLVRQRVGQQTFRKAMLDYWEGACAVTGVALPEILRASHAKPWAECVSDAERLDVYNGYLLSANLDALFDRFLITFNDDGVLIISPSIDAAVVEQLGLNRSLHLRWVANEHKPYLKYHREQFESI